MGMSVSTSRIYMQAGVDNQQEMKKYQELKKEAKEKLGGQFTTEHDKICSILAKDPNAAVADVESMYNQVQQYGMWGNSGSNNTQKLQAFQCALKNVPGYKYTNLSSENLKELLGIYNSSFQAQIKGKNQQETFNIQANDYIKNLSKPNVDNNLIGQLRDNNTFSNLNPIENVNAGAELVGNLNKFDLLINNTRNLFD